MQLDVHAKIASLFPMLVVNGWQYKGYGVHGFGGVPFYRLRFEKTIRDKRGFAKLQISQHMFNDPEFGLRDWIYVALHDEEARLIERRRRELDCAA